MTVESQSNLAPFSQPSAEYKTFFPAQPQPIGSVLPADKYPQNAKPPKLYEPLSIKGVTFPNRLWIPPMCMYSSDNGHATDFHFVHIGALASRGWQGIMVEATAVVPEGRISPEDAGLWSDSQIEPLKRQVDYVHALQGTIGIQLAHAGRKASTLAPVLEIKVRRDGWKGGSVPDDAHGGWGSKTYAPSPLSFSPGDYPDPQEASLEYLENLKQAYLAAVQRCKQIGFDYIEIHGAHGYLLHEFTDPVSNKRTDKYGGSLENRLRFPLELFAAIRAAWDKPLFYRFSASDWLEEVLGPEKAHPGQTEEYAWWGIEQSTIYAQKLRDAGLDLLDVSSGGNDPRQKIKAGPSYQVPFAAHIKKNVPDLLVGTVGIITNAFQAEEILENDQADIIFIGREALRNVDFPLKAAEDLGVAVQPNLQYTLAWTHMLVKRDGLKPKPKIDSSALNLGTQQQKSLRQTLKDEAKDEVK